MEASELQVYEIFKSRMSDREATVILEFPDTKMDKQFDAKMSDILKKQDKIDLIKWMVSFFVTQMLFMLGLYLKH